MLTAITYIYALALLALVIGVVYMSRTIDSLKKQIMVWVGFGFLTNYIILSAYYVTLPIEGVSSIAGFFVITGIIVSISLVLGGLYALVAYAVWKTQESMWFSYVALVLSWIVVEVARPYVFTLITWGGGSTFGAHGSSWSLGSILAATPLVVFAHWGGVFMLGAVLISIVGVLMYPFSLYTKLGSMIMFVCLYSFVVHDIQNISHYTKPLRIGVVQTAFPHVPQGEDIDRVYTERVSSVLHPLVMSLADQQPDIVILPEDVRYVDLQGVRLRQELSKAFPETVIVDGATRFIDGERKNTAIVFDIKTGTSSLRTKGVMFPFGEYVPYSLRPFIQVFVGEKKLKEYQAIREYGAGEYPKGLSTRFGTIGTLICSELTSHTALRALVQSSPDIAIVQSSLTWTNNRTYYAMNHVFSLKIMAVMLGKPVISVTNSGPTVMIDPFGRVTSFEPSSFKARMYVQQNGTVTKIQ